MIYTLTRDDIPSLSAWIKKSRSAERDFLAVRLILEPLTLDLIFIKTSSGLVYPDVNRFNYMIFCIFIP